MKALTIHQPHAEAIIRGLKRVEYRSRPTTFRGLLAIHAGKRRPPPSWLTEYPDLAGPFVLGAVVGLVRVTGCEPVEGGGWGWLLADPVRLTAPLPASGQLGLWDVDDALILRKKRTAVVNMKNVSPDDADGVVYVGRPQRFSRHASARAGSPLGNPFKAGPDGTIEEVLARYRAHVLASPALLALLPGLRGRRLGCWCCDGDAASPSPMCCHAQVLAELADAADAGCTLPFLGLPGASPHP